MFHGFRFGEISCPTRYFEEASSINFRRSVKYGLGVISTSVRFRLEKWGLARSAIFRPSGKRLNCVENPEAYCGKSRQVSDPE